MQLNAQSYLHRVYHTTIRQGHLSGTQDLRNRIRKVAAPGLESDGVNVCYVVTYDVHHHLVVLDSADSTVQ
ncbi:hypothetical protein BMS3Bbin04_00492 [bacterium BMS3Bbin04]|nr:hypothetical protein BMS3Bbin04_00492 [bacterium BMS3Bbin04]